MMLLTTLHPIRMKCASPTEVARSGRVPLASDERGIVAVEFALILPILLMLYLGLVEFAQGYRVSQKLDLLAHTLADLTAQQLPNPLLPPGPAIMDEATIEAIFNSAIPIMAPIAANTIQMTISEVDVEGLPSNNNATSWNAYVYWTVSRNSGALRTKCKNAGTPMLAMDVAPIASDAMPTSYTNTKTVMVGGAPGTVAPTVGAVIVADVSYNYEPGFSFVPFHWSQKPTFTIKKTSYAPVRNSYVPNHIQYNMTSGTNCNAPSP
jgi:Flp pilus assembly protein TadG